MFYQQAAERFKSRLDNLLACPQQISKNNKMRKNCVYTFLFLAFRLDISPLLTSSLSIRKMPMMGSTAENHQSLKKNKSLDKKMKEKGDVCLAPVPDPHNRLHTHTHTSPMRLCF
jgi:hypothetical protein